MAKRKQKQKTDPATEAYLFGVALLRETWLLRPILENVTLDRSKNNLCPLDGWAIVTNHGEIHVHPTRRGKPQEWQFVLAHCLLHLAFDHFKQQANDELFYLWNVACDIVVTRFLVQSKIGKQPLDIIGDASSLPSGSEEAIFRQLLTRALPDVWRKCGTTGVQGADMLFTADPAPRRYYWLGGKSDFPALFARGVSLAVRQAVADTSDVMLDKDGKRVDMTASERARQWFINHYPLLGALAARFEIREDARLCQQMEISVAAVDPQLKEIYINPAAGLSDDEMRFVMAHEMLHVGLRHDTRTQGRDPFLWNVACDYVINDWLVQMRVGAMPRGLLWDESLRGQSAETIYNQIVNDLRRYRRLTTLRGKGVGDILGGRAGWWQTAAGMSLDEFYRSALAEGLEYHQGGNRGYIPAGLIEEIRALSQPPIPWDVKLARWFDMHFPPLEKRRTYARPSRRQASTPDIPRPSYVVYEEQLRGRTFGVVLDTSGSMGRKLLAQALGAIASYSMARDVPLVRVVFCDATYYDAGYMPPEQIAERVEVKGRGGTILQPAIDFLEKSADFPKDGPMLIITDGYCDRLTIRHDRPHAYLLPRRRSLPFAPKGEVFYVVEQ